MLKVQTPGKECDQEEDLYGQQLQVQSFKYEVHEPSVHDEDLPFPTKEVGNYSR